MEHFSYRNGTLHAENVAITSLAQSFAPPFYLYSSASLRQNFITFQTALRQALPSRPPLVAYALKANANLTLLQLLAGEGSGADVVSEGELRRALAAGIAPQKIVFSGVGKTLAEIDFALSKKILCFNVESIPELHLLEQRAQTLGLRAPISLRINPDIDAGTHAKINTGRAEDKFGIAYAQARTLYQQAAQMSFIDIKGVDLHIGSQICDLAPFDKAFSAIAELVGVLRGDGHALHHVDVGGGLGIDHFHGETVPKIEDYARIIARHFGALDLDVICEPGRLIVGNAGILVTRVLYLKQTETKNFIIVDAAMNDLLRPTLYEARHKIIPICLPVGETHSIRADIVGPVCESGDYLGKDMLITQPQPNDLLAILSAGAYGASMASSYNARPLIPEILVTGAKFNLIRRRPSYEEMLALERFPKSGNRFSDKKRRSKTKN